MASIDNVLDVSPRVQYTAAAAQTAFDYPFPIFADTDLVVDVSGTTMALGTDYTVTGAGNAHGGTVTFVVGRTVNQIVTIYRAIAIQRTSDFQQNGPWSSATINDELDRITLVEQQLASQVGRAMRMGPTDQGADSDQILPDKPVRAGKFLVFDANGKPAVSGGTGSDAGLRADLAASGAVLIDASRVALTPSTRIVYTRTGAEISAVVVPADLSVFGPFIDPVRYGADPTGVADSTSAIQNAILVASVFGGLVFLRPGTFKISSTLKLHPNVMLMGSGCGDTSSYGITTRITVLLPTAAFSGTDIIRADPADFGADVYCRGIGVSNLFIDMFNVRAGSKRAINLRSISDAPTFDNLRVWNQDSGQALYVGVSANAGAFLSDGLIFNNFICNANGIDVFTGAMVILEDCNEITFRDGKILARSNGAPAAGTIGVKVLCTNIGCSAITFDATAFAGFETNVRGTATGGGTGVRWLRALNTTHETFKFGFVLDGTTPLASQFCMIGPGNRFISQIAGGSNIVLDHATSCTVIADEFSPVSSVVSLTANSAGNTVWTQPSQVTDLGTNNVILGRSAAGALQINRVFTAEGTFTLTTTAGITGSPTGTVRYTQVGNNVTMYLPAISAAATATGISFSGVPAALRPARQQVCANMVVNNSLDVCGFFRVNTDGTAILFANVAGSVGPFSNTGNQGMEACTISYNLL